MRKILCAFLVLTSHCLTAQDARTILQQYIDTVSGGDVRNWEKIKSMYSEGQSYYSQQDFEQKLNMATPDKPSYYKTYLVLPDNHKIEYFDDTTSTRPNSTFYFLEKRSILLIGNIPPIIKPAPEKDRFFSPHMPVYISNLMENSKSVELLGIKDFVTDGFSCYEIVMITKGRKYYLYINTQTLLLEYGCFGENEDRTTLGRYAEYKRFGELLMPMFDGIARNNILYYWNWKSKLKINEPIDPAIFEYKEK
jgi:hypothetical protein